METISVCIPSYNTLSRGEEVFKRAVNSISASIKYLYSQRNDVKVIISWVDTVAVFLSYKASLDKLVELTDINLRKTRGTVLSMVELFPEEEQINFIGIGSIFNRIITRDNTVTLFTLYGTVGYILPILETKKYKWPSKSLLIMHSDGLKTKWNLEDYPGLTDANPSIIAAILYRDYNRGTDDIVVMVIRNES